MAECPDIVKVSTISKFLLKIVQWPSTYCNNMYRYIAGVCWDVLGIVLNDCTVYTACVHIS